MDGFKAELRYRLCGGGITEKTYIAIPNYFKISVIATIRKGSVTLYQKPYQHGTLVISTPFGTFFVGAPCKEPAVTMVDIVPLLKTIPGKAD